MEKFITLFAGRNGLDHELSRFAVTRIPEVSKRIREAQGVLDQSGIQNFDLHNFILSDDDVFLANIKLKSLAAAVVQVGLFDRLSRNRLKPGFLIGNSNGDSALRVCAGEQTIADMIALSQALQVLLPQESTIFNAEVPALAGVLLTDYLVYRLQGDRYEAGPEKAMDSWDLLQQIIESETIDRVINVGPHFVHESQMLKCREVFDFNLVDSIEIDPMLSWFWRESKKTA